MKKHSVILLLLAAFFLPEGLGAQSLTVFGVNTDNYPNVKAKFYATDAADKQIINLSTTDFKIIEDGIDRPVTFVSCPEPRPPQPISSVLMMDVSGSMQGQGLDYAKAAAKAWVNTISLDKSECAIASFNSLNFINQDFTQDRQKLLNAIDGLTADDGTDFNAALINPKSGALLVAERGRNKRIVVLLTDGQSSGFEDEIVSKAASINATIYCVVLGMNAPDILKKVAERTGGQWFDNVRSGEQAEEIYKMILSIAQNLNPCEIEWTSEGCQQDKTAEITLLTVAITSRASYIVPASVLPVISASNLSLSFGFVQPGTKSEMTVTITAKYRPVTIQSIKADNPLFQVKDYGGAPPPFTLQPEEKRDIKIEFSAPDSNYYFTRIEITGNACIGNLIYATAGIYAPGKSKPTLKLTRPNGKEYFPAGIDTVITWEGVLPSEKVRLEYSTDGGKSWIFITDTASGLEYKWKVPNTPSKTCLMKVSQMGENGKEPRFINLEHHGNLVSSISWNPDGRLLATASGLNLNIWDAQNGINLISWNTGVPLTNLSWSSDGGKIAGITSDGKIYIWDVGSGQPKKTFTFNYRPNCVTNNYSLQWSPDGQFLAIVEGGRICIIDPETGVRLKTFGGNDKSSTSVHWSPDKSRILAESHQMNFGYNTIWDVNTGDEVLTVGNDTVNTCIMGMDWAPDSKLFATNYFLKGYLGNNKNDYELRIYDSKNGAVVKALKLKSNTSNVSWNPNGNLIAFGSLGTVLQGYSVAMIWDVNSDSTWLLTVIDTSSGRKTIREPLSLQWSPDGCQLAACGYSDHNDACIWNFCKGTLQEDVSDTLWTIAQLTVAARNVDMGKVLVNHSKDSVVSQFLMSYSPDPVRIDSIYFTGADASMFSLVSGIPPFEIPPTGTKDVEFRFSPSSVGIKTAKINIHTDYGETIHSDIRGEGVEDNLLVNSDILDFGQVWTGRYRDSVKVMIKNTGTSAVDIDSTAIIGPDMTQFSVQSGGGAFRLEPNGERELKMRFSPTKTGRTSTKLAFYYKGTGSPAMSLLYGEGIELRVIVSLPDTSAIAGTKGFRIPLRARIDNDFLDSTVFIDGLSFTAEIRFGADVFLPMNVIETYSAGPDGKPQTVLNASGNNITLSRNFSNIFEIRGTVMLPEKHMNELVISDFKWSNPGIKTEIDTGSIDIKICAFNLTHVKMLEPLTINIQQNPAKDNINFNIEGEETGQARLTVYSYNGAKVEEVTIDKQGAEAALTLSTEKFEQGVYYAVVYLGMETARVKFVVIK